MSTEPGRLMTLAAAFRCSKGGILLCADREWNDAGISKREIDKIYRINLEPCEVFLAGSGPDEPVIRAYSDIPEILHSAAANGTDIFANHRDLLESALLPIHQKFAKLLRQWPMSFLIIVAPRALNKVPMLYWTNGPALNADAFYYSVGSGKPVADYLSDRLYEYGKFSKRDLAILAAFILRETAGSSVGVGMGANMVFIHEGEKAIGYISPGIIKEMQEGIPGLSDAIQAYWPGKLNFPDWYAS